MPLVPPRYVRRLRRANGGPAINLFYPGNGDNENDATGVTDLTGGTSSAPGGVGSSSPGRSAAAGKGDQFTMGRDLGRVGTGLGMATGAGGLAGLAGTGLGTALDQMKANGYLAKGEAPTLGIGDFFSGMVSNSMLGRMGLGTSTADAVRNAVGGNPGLAASVAQAMMDDARGSMSPESLAAADERARNRDLDDARQGLDMNGDGSAGRGDPGGGGMGGGSMGENDEGSSGNGDWARGGLVQRTHKAPSIGPSPRGLLNSDIPGRTDRHDVDLKNGSYVVPADVVSGLGEGNTMAGSSVLDMMFKSGPAGVPATRSKYADGGTVPVTAAGGEYVITPEEIETQFGDLKTGHDLLDKFVLSIRDDTTKTLKGLRGPRK